MAGQLTRRVIIDAAIRFVDEYGLEQLTMRRLGAELEVEAMALYRYVNSREELLNLILDTLVDDLFDRPNLATRAKTWQQYLTFVAHNMRSLAIDHPAIFPLLCTKPTLAPWISPPLRSLRWVEHVLEELREFGFSKEEAVGIYKSLARFLVGSLLQESAWQPGLAEQLSSANEPSADQLSGHLADFPLVAEYRPLLQQDRSEREFDDEIDELLERIRVSTRAGNRVAPLAGRPG